MREPHEVARVGVLIAMIGGRGALEEAWQLYSRARIEQGSEYAAHIFWAKIERRVLVAVLDELSAQAAIDWRDPAVRNASYAARYVQDARHVVAAAQAHPVTYALGVFDSRRDFCVNKLRHIQLEDTTGYRQHACNAARAALCLPRDPLALWDYMLEQLWLSAHDKTGGEAGMAQRLHDALITIFEEEVR